MAHYLFQCSYTPEAWATQLKNPQNRDVTPVLEAFGGLFVGFVRETLARLAD